MIAHADNQGKISSVTAKASSKQSLSDLAKAFFLTAIGNGEAAAKHIRVCSEARKEDGSMAIRGDECVEIEMKL